MKTIHLIILLTINASMALGYEPSKNTLTAHPGIPPASSFTLARSDKEISIFYRWVIYDDTCRTRQLKAEFTVDSPIENILAVLRDDKSFTSWMNNTRSYYRVRSVTPENWYSYVQFSVPWPLDNQDCILHYHLIPATSSGEVHVRITGDPAFIRTFDGVERIEHLEIDWVLKPCGPHRTRVEYYVVSHQENRFPRRITDPIIQNNLIKTMDAFRSTVKERRGI